MKAKELREMTTAELESKLADLKKDLFFLRMQHATNQLDNPLKINVVKYCASCVNIHVATPQECAARDNRTV